MAPPGKFRSKRASSSYSSTLTTVGFIALCVFGVWMLTSDSIVPPDTSAGVIIEDPATARLVDNKASDLPVKSTVEESNFGDTNQKEEEKPEENKPEEKKEAETVPESQSKPETGGGGDNVAVNQEDKQENSEARGGDEEGAKTQNGETNAAVTETTTGAEPKEDVPQAGNQNQDQVEKSDQMDQNNQNQNLFEQTNQNQNQEEQSNQNQNQLDQNQEQNQQNKDQIEDVSVEEQRRRDQVEHRVRDQLEQRSRDQSNQIEDQVEQRSRDQSNQIEDQVEQRSSKDQSNQIEDQVEQRSSRDQRNQIEDQVEQTSSRDQSNQIEDQVEQRSRDQSNRNEDQVVEERRRDRDQSNRNEDQVEERSRDRDQRNRNEDEVEQRNNQRQVTIPTKDSGERREKSNWNRSDQSSDPEHQRQQDQKREAEQQQRLRDRAEQQLQLPEEDSANPKVEESEAQMAQEEQQKQQAERHNMMSEEEQQIPVQQHKSDHKLDGHEFSDQTNNPDTKSDSDQDTKTDSDQDDDTKSQLPDKPSKQQADTESRSNPGGDEEAKQETKESRAWSTQAVQSENQKERHATKGREGIYGYTWQLCNETSGADFIPCLDNEKALRRLRTTRHFEHRERHCPEDPPTCLVPLPEGYKTPITWPSSKDRIWYHNVPHTSLAEFKGHQNWVKVTGEFLTFPGGGTQFINGANYYLDFIQQVVPDISWGKHIRVTLDVGCGVASFGGYLFDRDVLTMSFAPKDEHEAQVQFALERGIPAISAVMGSQRLPFPSRVFDLVHCARCRVPWHEEGGRLLMELNRVLRPGGYFVWSATPVYQKDGEDLEIWNEMSALTISMCLELVTIKRNKINKIAAAIYRKPKTNECYQQRKHKNPPMCKSDDDASAAWYVPLQSCIHEVPVDPTERGSRWPEEWPERLQKPPYWLNSSQIGIYGKPAPEDFSRDYLHWKMVVERSYLKGLGIDWTNVRNVMDMRSVYGGFAAALKDLKVWVLNVVNTDSPDTLPIIYERGLFGIYHDWCESFSSYPRSYDLLHADHLFSSLKKRCKTPPLMVEIDRLLRPGGKLIVRDESSIIGEIENLLKSLHWEVRLISSKSREGLLCAQKTDWRPDTYEASA